MTRALESLKWGLVWAFAFVGTVDFLRTYHSTSRILGYAAGIAALLLVVSLPRLRSDESGFAFVESALGVSVLGGVLLATTLVVHSWRWIVFAAMLVSVNLLDLGITYVNDKPGLPDDPEPAELHKPSADVWQNLPRF